MVQWLLGYSCVVLFLFGRFRVRSFALSALSFGAIAAGWRAFRGSVVVSALIENADKQQSDIPGHPATAGSRLGVKSMIS